MTAINSPTGFGAWVAFQATLGPFEKTIQLCKDIGAQWLAPRAGAGRSRDSRWSSTEARASIQKAHAAGLKIYPWIYTWPSAQDVEVQIFKMIKDEGADGIFIDAEIEYQQDGGHKVEAEDFMKKLRAALGDDFPIMHAPFPYVLYHVQFPYVEFGKYCDQVHPQTYWSEISDAGAEKHTLAAQAQWDEYSKTHPEILGMSGQVCHIGVTYGKEIGGPTPGTFRPSDLKWFMDWCKAKELVSWSVYSLDAMNHQAYLTLKAINDGTDVPADPPGSGTHTSGLQGGDSGPAVKSLQEKLNGMGYNLSTDGVFGLGTKTAIQDFQKKHGMQQTGVWTPACDAVIAAPAVVTQPVVPVTVQPVEVPAPVVQLVQPAPAPIVPVKPSGPNLQTLPIFAVFNLVWGVVMWFIKLLTKKK